MLWFAYTKSSHICFVWISTESKCICEMVKLEGKLQWVRTLKEVKEVVTLSVDNSFKMFRHEGKAVEAQHGLELSEEGIF